MAPCDRRAFRNELVKKRQLHNCQQGTSYDAGQRNGLRSRASPRRKVDRRAFREYLAQSRAKLKTPKQDLELDGRILRITVQNLAGDSLETLDLDAAETGLQLKEKLASAIGIPVETQSLVCGSSTILDAQRLCEADVDLKHSEAPICFTIQLVRILPKIKHPTLSDEGGWSGCGGNPTGKARCSGSGNCSNDCSKCGASTHWRCCGSTVRHSVFCIPGTLRAQAHKNDLQCREKYNPNDPPVKYVTALLDIEEADGEDEINSAKQCDNDMQQLPCVQSFAA